MQRKQSHAHFIQEFPKKTFLVERGLVDADNCVRLDDDSSSVVAAGPERANQGDRHPGGKPGDDGVVVGDAAARPLHFRHCLLLDKRTHPFSRSEDVRLQLLAGGFCEVG